MIVKKKFITEQIEIIRGFHLLQEEQLTEFLDNPARYYKKCETEVVEEQHDGGYSSFKVESRQIGGITDGDYDLSLFTEYRPMYQRQAMLLTLWAAFENEVEEYVCLAEKKANTALKPKSGSTIEKLNKRIEHLDASNKPSSKYGTSFKFLNDNVRIVRNKWAHEAGCFGEQDERLKKIISETNDLVVENFRIIISKSYIDRVIKCMLVFSREIDTFFKKLGLI